MTIVDLARKSVTAVRFAVAIYGDEENGACQLHRAFS